MEQSAPRAIVMPDIPALAVGPRAAAMISADGELRQLSLREAARLVSRGPVMLCHAPSVARRLAIDNPPAADILELFAFVRPAQFCLPTVGGVMAALGLPPPGEGLEDHARLLVMAARALLAELGATDYPYRPGADALAATLDAAGWPWGGATRAALGPAPKTPGPGLEAWRVIEEWRDSGPEPPPDDIAVSPARAGERLARLIGTGAEDRPGQRDYAAGVSAAFTPRGHAEAPNLVLAEAGTGVGKTLAYIAPASLWAEVNGGPVWLSTFTKNLQRQVDQELDRLYPDPGDKAVKAVIRKGRENYLCLLNFREAVVRAGSSVALGGPSPIIALGLVARWARYSRDGDMVGGDFPAWLMAGLTAARPGLLTDRRGECIHSACDHYRRCFIERATRKARHAEIVVANHALIMVLAALGGGEETPARLVLDEGHHLFDAADSAFSAHLSGREGAELRRWLRGAEGRGRGRARGLEGRINDLVVDQPEAARLMRKAVAAAAALPAEGWLARLSQANSQGPAERFLGLARDHVQARATRHADGYSLEAAAAEPAPELLAAATVLATALGAISGPLGGLRRALLSRLDEDARTLDSATRGRIEAAARGLARRCDMLLKAWRSMLGDLGGEVAGGDPGGSGPAFVDWFSIDRVEGRELDVGLHRHWIDPTRPFAEAVLEPAHGVVITSATLRDQAPAAGGEAAVPDHWASAEMRTGAQHMVLPAERVAVTSPFDYPVQTRVVVITDVRRNDPAQVASAYRELFLAAGGGALGLFTAIARLRAVHGAISGALDSAGLPLYAQHVDPFDTGTLVDIFRAEERACLLGTDAVRDGIDVPGRSLRLIVFERVPWPRPGVLHRARRAAFGGRQYDDLLTRFKLKQAYGRLIRRRDDRGVFVMLDPATPSRLATAFPDGVEVRRLGLAEAIALTRRFVGPGSGEKPA